VHRTHRLGGRIRQRDILDDHLEHRIGRQRDPLAIGCFPGDPFGGGRERNQQDTNPAAQRRMTCRMTRFSVGSIDRRCSWAFGAIARERAGEFQAAGAIRTRNSG
jgi:hypothetical protein